MRVRAGAGGGACSDVEDDKPPAPLPGAPRTKSGPRLPDL